MRTSVLCDAGWPCDGSAWVNPSSGIALSQAPSLRRPSIIGASPAGKALATRRDEPLAAAASPPCCCADAGVCDARITTAVQTMSAGTSEKRLDIGCESPRGDCVTENRLLVHAGRGAPDGS